MSLDNQNEPNTIEEQGIPNLQENTKVSSWRKRIGLAFILVILLITLGISLSSFSSSKKKMDAKKLKGSHITHTVPKREFEEEKTRLKEQEDAILKQDPYEQAHIQQKPVSVPVIIVDQSRSALMVKTDSGKGELSVRPEGAIVQSADEGNLSQALKSTKTKMVYARRLKDLHYLITKGKFIRCALQTRLDTTVPGMVACKVLDNVYSADGKVLLIERGSEATGEYQSDLKRGQARIFVLWSRIRTPGGIDIDIDSSGTDELGGSGVPGFVNDHFWQRFGGAILISLIQDVSKGLSERIANSNNRISLSNTESSGSGMAVETLKNSINIPPTLYKNHGDEVGIYIARDLNFRNVYDLQLK